MTKRMTKKDMLDWILILNDHYDVTVYWVTDHAYMWTDLLSEDEDRLHDIFEWYWRDMYNSYCEEKGIHA